MCRFNRIFNNAALDKFSCISLIFNALIISLNLVILIFLFLCLIQGKYKVLLKTEMLSYINIILLCILMIIIIALIEYYRFKNYLIKTKINTSIIFLSTCSFISIIEFIKSFDSILSIKRYMLLYNISKRAILDDYIYQLQKRMNKQKNYLTIISIIFIFLLILYILYIIIIYNMKIVYFSLNFNNDERFGDVSTEVDIDVNQNGNQIGINILNMNNIKCSYFVSKKIVDKIEKEYKDKYTQTIF